MTSFTNMSFVEFGNFLQFREMIMGPQSSTTKDISLKYQEMRFQIGSIIKVSEVPYHFGLVRGFQSLLYVLFLERRMITLNVMSTFPSMVEKRVLTYFLLANIGMTICGFAGVRTHSSGSSRT
jgi:hypothetical protein